LPAAEFIDAHHHLWDLEAVHYPWLMARGERRFFGDPTPIQRNYLPGDFLSESSEFVPSASVHIQVGAEDGLAETAWVSEQQGCAQAIVAFCDLSSGNAAEQLDALQAYERLRGIRQIVGRHAEEDRVHGSDALPHNPRWLAGLQQLTERRLSFDLQMIPRQMPAVLDVLRQVPDLRVALCHCGSPWDQDAEGLRNWRQGLEAFANLPNTVCKVSGLGMFNPGWQVEDLKPIVDTVIDVFSPQRLMFGSNFPVDKLYRSYDNYWSACFELLEDYSPGERAAMLRGTARRFYELGRG
jgi:predicted TIM-barrel fold metal-dependent hydrolase